MGIRGFVILTAICAVTMADTMKSAAVEAVIDSINQFSPTFFKEVANDNRGNVIVSSFSAAVALAMFGYGSRDKTEAEFKRVLRLPERSVGTIGYAHLLNSDNDPTDVEFHLANRIFINEEFTIEAAYHEFIRSTFHAVFHKSDFVNAQRAVGRINEWVGEITHNNHTDILSADSLPETTNMVLLCAVYFKGLWDGPFQPVRGGDKPFHVTTSQVENVPFIHRLARYKYGVLSELEARFVELPYMDASLSMIIILPDAIDGLEEVEEKLARRDIIELIENANETRIDVSIPKFKIESTFDLIYPLQKMGLRRAFNEDSSDFNEIFDIGLYIDSFIQRTSIHVDENGSDVDSIIRVGGAPPGTKVFYVDHPFHLSIIRKDILTNRKYELFTGRVVDPS